MISQFHVALVAFFILRVLSVAPIWTPTEFVEAANYRIFDGDVIGRATNTTTPENTITFATSFPGIPKLCYGMSNYQSEDTLVDEKFQINRTALTSTSFSLLVFLTGITNIWTLELRYMAVSPAFPYHLNCFDNVPINYGTTLTNITTSSSSTKTFYNTINYTAQATAQGFTFRYFSTPLSNNKILLFMTAFFIDGVNDMVFTAYPLDLQLSATPISNQTYSLYATWKINSKISRLHFSIIIFDQTNVEASGQYKLVYSKINYTVSGGSYVFPVELETNFMIGFVQFSSLKTYKQLHFILTFQNISGSYGVTMLPAVPRDLNLPLSRFCYSIFYIKGWVCPNGTYYDTTMNTCLTCSDTNCINCINASFCVECSTNYAVNSSTGQCYQQQCTLEGCTNCINMTACLTCNATLNYVLVANLTCVYCPLNLNYFPNEILQSCQLCTLSNCLNCSSLTTCRQCNSAASYYIGTNNTCSYCNNSQNFFINSSFQCQSCLVTNCLACQTLTTCQTCNPGYLINTTNSQCASCSLSNCATCSNLTACQICTTGYVLNSATKQCEVCTLTGCLNCSTTTICVQCNTSSNYILSFQTCQFCPLGLFANSTSNTCEVCTLSNCLTCTSLTSCSSCNTGASYYLSSGTCSYCDPGLNMFINSTTLGCQVCTIPFCINCSSLTVCQNCSPSFVINNTDNLCYQCTLSNCITCFNLSACQFCDVGFVLNPTTGLCQVCTLTGCINCSTATTCVQCDTIANFILSLDTCQLCSAGLFANATSSTCQACTIPNCLTCSSLISCSSCDTASSYYLSSGNCPYCDPLLNMFINSTTQGCETCTIPFCGICQSLTSCLNCSSGYSLNPADGLCYPCCPTICDNTIGYFLNATSSICQLCSIANCQTCSTLNTCSICSFGYFVNSVTGQCENQTLPNCGNGIFLLPQQCDDGNLLDGDGCSSTCTVQANYTCEPNPTPLMLNSVCFYIGEITLKVVYIEKVDNANKLEILLQIGPKDANFWKGVDFSNMVSLSNMTGFDNYNVRMNADGTVSIIANYNTTIHNMNITVQLDPSLSGKDALSRYPPVSKQFEMVPTDNELAVYYDSSAYLIAKIAQALAYTVAASSLFFFLIGLFADKLVGVEMMAVIQISHLSLIGLSNLNPVFKTLANIWFVNGFNYFSLSKGYLLDQSTPLKVKGIYLYSYFIQNYNFTFLLILIPLLFSIVFLILSIKLFNLKRREKFLQFAKNCACEYAFTGLMFGGYIVSVSFALQVFYGFNNLGNLISASSITIWTLIICLIILYFILKIIKPQHFGEFTEKFNEKSTEKYELQNNLSDLTDENKQSWKTMISKFHYNFLIIERIIIGTCLIFMMNIKFSLLLPILVFLMFVFESIILKPYSELKHNIRFISNMIISIVILTIYLAYNLANQDNPLSQNKIWIFMPLLVCALLLICVIYNAVFLVKSLIRKISRSCKKDEPQNGDWLKEMTNQNLEINPTITKIFEQIKPDEQLGKITAHKLKLSQIRKRVQEQQKIDRKFEKRPALDEAELYAEI